MAEKKGFGVYIVAVLLLISSIVLIFGGGYLAILGGSWYYLFCGVTLLLVSYYLQARDEKGFYIFFVLYIGSIFWTIYESGTDYWGWIPRLSILTIFGLFISLLLPFFNTTKLGSYKKHLSFLFVLIFIVAFGMAYLPYNVYFNNKEIPNLDREKLIDTETTQNQEDWAYYGRDEKATRFSPLTQINSENVNQLKRAWVYRTGDLPKPGQVNKWAAETTPIKVGDYVYLCSATNNIIKLDAKTGKEIWKHNSGVAYKSIPYTAACKGVTYYTSKKIPKENACHNKIILATLDARLLAVDADTGKSCEKFGNKGQTDLLNGLGYTVPGFVAVTAPVPIVRDVIVVNHQVLDGQRRWAPSGVIRGYDVDTGNFKWAWDVNNPGVHTEPKDGEQYSRGTPNSWAAMIGDNRLGLVYVPTGNSAADYYSALRTENENRVSSSIVALDVETGNEKWIFQTVHKDVWDYDLGSQPTLFEHRSENNVVVPAMIIPTKRGQTFIVNRENGEPISKVVEKSAPSGNVPGDPRAPTQPWSVEMPRLGFPDLQEKKMWGISLFDQLYCRIKFKKANYEGEFTAPSIDKPWIEYPGYNGGSDWGSMAYDPQSGVLIANWNNTPMYDRLVTRGEANKQGLISIDSPKYKPGSGGAEGNGAMQDTPYGINVSPFLGPGTKMLCNEPPYGMITAINLHSKKIIWQRPLGSAENNGPFGIKTHLPINVGTPNNGGPIITAGGVVFVAATTDNKIRAFDVKTGKELWSDKLPAGGQATPMTYSLNGKQYLIIMAGGHHFMETGVGDYVISYALE